MKNPHNLRTIAIIPVYRDDDTITRVLAKFKEKVVDEICIVIDNASEKCVEKIRGTAVAVPVHIIENEERKGIGYAIKQGIRYAIDRRHKIVVILAGNNKDDPRQIPQLIQPIIKEGYDYVQGSRFLPEGKSINNPHLRGLFSRLFPYVWTWSTKIRCTDVTNGFRAYKLKLFEDPQINIWQGWLDGYELEYYLHYKVLTLGYRTVEIPVSKVYSQRHRGGYSRISPFKDWWKIVGPLVYLHFKLKR